MKWTLYLMECLVWNFFVHFVFKDSSKQISKPAKSLLNGLFVFIQLNRLRSLLGRSKEHVKHPQTTIVTQLIYSANKLSLLITQTFIISFPVDPNNRVAPSEPPTHRNDGRGYAITTQRLAQIRGQFMYWFFDQGGPENMGDLQRDIHASNQQVHKNFNFQLPFFGFRFNYTRVCFD